MEVLTMSNKILGYFMRVDKESGQKYRGYFGELENTLRNLQDYAGYNHPHSLIQVIHLTDDIDVIMDEEGKLRQHPVNRAMLSEDGKILDIVVGNIVCVRHESDKFVSILESDRDVIEKYLVPVLTLLGNTVVLEAEDKLPEYEEG